jgi:peroxiredoxin
MGALHEVLPNLERQNAALVAIPPQTVKHTYFMSDQNRLCFPLFSNAGNQVARKFGLVYHVPPEPEEVLAALEPTP